MDEPAAVEDYVSLSNEYMGLKNDLEKANELERKCRTQDLSSEEASFLSCIPAKMRRAVEITRILRRTTTGPAKIKSPKTTKKGLKKEELSSLLDAIT